MNEEPGELRAVLWGTGEPVGTSAEAYAVVALLCEEPGTNDLGARIDHALTACGHADAVRLLRDDCGYLLAPAPTERHAEELGRRLHAHLRGPLRLAVAWRGRGEVADGREEARTVLDIVTGLRWPPGVYRVADVVLEYAVMQDKATMAALLTLIRPVVQQEVLRTTLETFVAASGNRSKTANALNIHRSTLEYRLDRVDQLTGCSPTTTRGLRTLAAALTVHEVAHQQRHATW